MLIKLFSFTGRMPPDMYQTLAMSGRYESLMTIAQRGTLRIEAADLAAVARVREEAVGARDAGMPGTYHIVEAARDLLGLPPD